MRRGDRRSGGASCEADCVAVLAMPDDLTRNGRFTLARAAQLADDPMLAPGVDVHLLACQRCTPAVDAAVPVGLERADPATQQQMLELLYMGGRRGHDDQ
jgi:hypothetical protein